MERIEKALKVNSFFVLDENFLLHRKRALRLLELMKQHEKSWSLYVFSSARVLKSYNIEQLVGLGISWVWMGLEGENSQYEKLGAYRHPRLGHIPSIPRHPCPGLFHHWAWKITLRKTSMR